MRCDNTTTAAVQELERTYRVLKDGYHRLKLHHRFEVDFCNPAIGNEKGNVENKVRYDCRKMLVAVPVMTDFNAFYEELLVRCDADHHREHYLFKYVS